MRHHSSTINLDRLSSIVTKRPESLFSENFLNEFETVMRKYESKTILIIGAAGSIGSATIFELVNFRPKKLILLDISENGLVALTRTLRLHPAVGKEIVIRPIVADVLDRSLQRLAEEEPSIDMVLNFSAMKHVRSEGNIFSLIRMLQVNILGAENLVRLCSQLDDIPTFFSVSTDKAANPVNLMGASKRLMEATMFQQTNINCSSSRFANVAFSQGSLLESWLDRIALNEIVPVPENTFRYFLSPKEAGQLCLLAPILCEHGEIAIPRLNAENNLVNLESLLCSVLEELELKPVFVGSEADAVHLHHSGTLAAHQRVVLRTPLDTEGEKSYEKFRGSGDSVVVSSLSSIEKITPTELDAGNLESFINDIRPDVANFNYPHSKQYLIRKIEQLIPNFQYEYKDARLDNRI